VKVDAVPVVFVSVLEVIHVAADVLVCRVVHLSLFSDAEFHQVAGVLHDKLALCEWSGCDDTATLAWNVNHLQHTDTISAFCSTGIFCRAVDLQKPKIVISGLKGLEK